MLPGSRSHLALLAPFDDGTPSWRDAHGEPFTFDYAFVGEDLPARVRGLRIGRLAQGSDHLPLLLELDRQTLGMQAKRFLARRIDGL
jgi:endonuclease/exonuclease/phosphatase family metal-dependent hydrolase